MSFLIPNFFHVQVLPNMISVADIKATLYDVCGVVKTIGDGFKSKVKSIPPRSLFVNVVCMSNDLLPYSVLNFR